jgi:hypothetical protein
MNEFICKKETVREVLEYHQLTCQCGKGYPKISNFLDTMPDYFPYNDFCGKLEEVIRVGRVSKFEDVGDRFKNGLLERMTR